ncbi:hypothetical protein KKC1_22590 [Calderihabitans maritimus]|uniref:Uncharacterized protein n=1 Tax=Calderihabitans maritimus TaxID=1246530 RepID=A0A1Z5HUN4_9FIRM|nr:hypothetical protein KKC1_22590 [Calderihabitans maritimus]
MFSNWFSWFLLYRGVNNLSIKFPYNTTKKVFLPLHKKILGGHNT